MNKDDRKDWKHIQYRHFSTCVCLGSNQTQGLYARQNSVIELEYTQACIYVLNNVF